MGRREAGHVMAGIPTSPGVAVGPLVRLENAPTAGSTGGHQGRRPVLVAAEISPAQVVALDPAAVAAVVTAAGAPLSHASILVRSLGIPAVTGLGRQPLEVPEGTLVLVDGDAGTLEVSPGPDAVETAETRRGDATRVQEQARRLAGASAATVDGRVVPVLANVGGPEEAATAVSEGADGIGMLRTEFTFLNRREPPGEDEQYEAYARVARAIGDRSLVVRTLDLGADVPAWDALREPNPALGNRGIRLTLSTPDLLGTQLRAVARLAQERPLQLMFPMVTTIDELRLARAGVESAREALPQDGTNRPMEIGITVEVPAAAVTADVFAPLVDFFAIGTNDLTQYTLAADRGNAAVAGIADGLHPAVLRLIREVTAAAERHGRPVEVVGELGSDPLGIPILLGLGVTRLSVRPNAVAGVKQVVRATELVEALALAEAALGAESATAVRELGSRRGRA